MKCFERFQNIASYCISPSCTPHLFTSASQTLRSDPSSVNLAFVLPHICVNSSDNFCYICGEVAFARRRKAITEIVKKAYHLYFGCKIGDQDKPWAPHICCRKCATDLLQWLKLKWHAMPFDVRMVWREPNNHATDCYFCMAPPVSGGITMKKKWTIVYPNIQICSPSSSARRRNFRSRTSERIYHARHHPNRTHDLCSGSQDHHPSTNCVQKTICSNLISSAPDDGCMRPKHVELRKHQ